MKRLLRTVCVCLFSVPVIAIAGCLGLESSAIEGATILTLEPPTSERSRVDDLVLVLDEAADVNAESAGCVALMPWVASGHCAEGAEGEACLKGECHQGSCWAF
ncbi:MAG: hypothetical protein JRH20_05675 [Deltaproteobacteria bacterium]|nr:hypothetical protein [Deltaproteobacteria bacterium]